MFRTVLAAALVAATAGLPAAPAAAGHHLADCGFEVVPAGAAYEVVGYGVVAGAPGDAVSVSCELSAGPDHVLTTSHRPGTGAAVTYGRTSWTPGLYGVDHVCVVAVVNGITDRSCFHVDTAQVPPQAVYDVLFAVLDLVDRIDPRWLCPFLQAAAGDYGAVTVNAQGDVFVAGEPEYDCPPYDQGG